LLTKHQYIYTCRLLLEGISNPDIFCKLIDFAVTTKIPHTNYGTYNLIQRLDFKYRCSVDITVSLVEKLMDTGIIDLKDVYISLQSEELLSSPSAFHILCQVEKKWEMSDISQHVSNESLFRGLLNYKGTRKVDYAKWICDHVKGESKMCFLSVAESCIIDNDPLFQEFDTLGTEALRYVMNMPDFDMTKIQTELYDFYIRTTSLKLLQFCLENGADLEVDENKLAQLFSTFTFYDRFSEIKLLGQYCLKHSVKYYVQKRSKYYQESAIEVSKRHNKTEILEWYIQQGANQCLLS
jgi:hypothetical protein